MRTASVSAASLSLRLSGRGSVGAIRSRRACTQSKTALRVMASDAATERKPSPLEKGGTLAGAKALGIDASSATLAGKTGQTVATGKFMDARWVNGTWDLAQFKVASGETDWDSVIDAEIVRRRALEQMPEPSELEDEVKFDTSVVPWWAWVRRFHLPEAERINGRAAMIGFATGYLVDALTGAGLVDQTNSFPGKLLMWATFAGVAFVRSTSDLEQYKGFLKEATFYDAQWQATWQGVTRPSEKE